MHPRFHRFGSFRYRLLVCGASLVLLSACGGGGGSTEPSVELLSVYPARGSTLGGDSIQLKGQGFVAGTRVTLDRAECTAVTVRDASTLTCLTPGRPSGEVDVEVIVPDGGRARASGAFVYRPSGTGMSSFGVLAAAPLAGAYEKAFSSRLESVVTGFNLTTMKKSWTVNGKAYKDGETVSFDSGSHAVTLTVSDSTGDVDAFSYTIVVGEVSPQQDLRVRRAGADEHTFALSGQGSIVVTNSGLFPILNPRLIGAGKPDYVDWARYLATLARLNALPASAAESDRFALLEAAWRDMSNTTEHICSPGREGEFIIDPVLLLRGYGYECCTNASRALAYLGGFLDIPSRVRSTLAHEFPEFSVGGRPFILDPDLRFRFWAADGRPLSAWSAADSPLSLQNVTRYVIETAAGRFQEVEAGGTVGLGSMFDYPESDLRAAYIDGVVADTVWSYHEAFSKAHQMLHPGERIAFRQTSTYVPLQTRGPDGTNGGFPAPAVGKVALRQVWSASGPRTFERDAEGNRVIRLHDLPFPLQDLVIYFSKPIDPGTFWLTQAGSVYRIGDLSANTWTVSAQQLRALDDVSDLAAVVSKDHDLVAVEIGMQFNPRVFGDPDGEVSLTYTDDSGPCQRRVSVAVSGDISDVAIGSEPCDPRAPQRVTSSHALLMGSPGAEVISSYGNSARGTWGIVAPPGIRGHAELALPRTPGLPALLRAINEGFPADWHILQGNDWVALEPVDTKTAQWIALPSASSTSSRLRVTLRQAPAQSSTYLSYLSLIEGHAPAWPPFISAGAIPDDARRSIRQ